MNQKVLKTGNSLAVTIPSDFAKLLGVKPGDDVQVKADLSKASFTCTFTSQGQLSLLAKN